MEGIENMKKESMILLNKNTYPLYVGGSFAENFQDWDGKGSSVLLEAAVLSESFSVVDITWEIENRDIADFEEDCEGLITDGRRRVRARQTGITTVVAQLPDGARAECCLTVIDSFTRFTVSEIVLNTQKLHLKKGDSAQLIPILYPKDIYGNGMLDTSLVWESKDEKIASVEKGKIIGVGNGETDIVVHSVDVGRMTSCHVIVSESVTVLPEQEVKEAIRELRVGESINLLDEKNSRRSTRQFVWRSDNRYIADVDDNGCVTAYSASLAQEVSENGMKVCEVPETIWIYATEIEGGNVTKYPIRVNPVPVSLHGISVFPSELSIPVGESKKVSAIICPSVPHQYPISWESSNEQILTVAATEGTVYGEAQALVSAKCPGEVTVTITIEGISTDCKITVTEDIVKVDSIQMENQLVIDVDQVLQIHPVLPECATNKKLHWLGTDFSVATLDREGNVQGYKAGECKIYTIADDSLSVEKRALLKELQERGVLSKESDGESLQSLLSGTVYAECTIRVKDECNALRNLHIVEESVTDNSILLLWNRATLLDTGDFDRYQVFCNGELVTETKKLGYRAEGLEPSTMYRFEVAALDMQGNVMFSDSVAGTTRPKSEVINVLHYGAVGNGKNMDTYFIQRAIDECPKGGTVLLPENHVFVSGALFLKSDMTFQVDGILLGSDNPKDYPRVYTKWEGWRKLEQSADCWENTTEKVPDNHCPHASLLNAGGYEEGENSSTGPYNLENLVICGKGQINANGFVLAYNEGANINTLKVTSREYPVKDATSRGSAIRIHNGKNVYMKDVQVAYAPGWTIHTIYCEHITFDGMEVVSQGDGDFGRGTDIFNCGHIFNGDGIDPESCVHVNMFDILFTTGDDAVAIKSGRGREGNELDKPNAYIRITDCISRWSLGGFGTGSETAAGSHDLLFQNLTIEDILISGIWLKTNFSRGGITEYIQVRDMTAEKCDSPVWIFHTYSADRPQANPAECFPTVRHLVFENVHGHETNKLGFRLQGCPECMIQDITLRGVSSGGREDRITYCENLVIKNQD